MSDGLMSAAEWKAEKERRARILEGLDDAGKQAMEEEWKRSGSATTQSVLAAKAENKRFEYGIIKIERDERLDTEVVEEAMNTLNHYAQDGWRLHTYSQAVLDRGSLGAALGPRWSNVLHLVIEREVQG